MTRSCRLPLLVAIAAMFAAGGPDRLWPVVSAQAQAERVNVLIGFHQQPGPAEQALVRAFGGQVRVTYHLVPAVAATVPAAAVTALQNNPNVTVVETDGIVTAYDATTELNSSWGVKRIGAGDVHPTYTGLDVRVAVIDTGYQN